LRLLLNPVGFFVVLLLFFCCGAGRPAFNFFLAFFMNLSRRSLFMMWRVSKISKTTTTTRLSLNQFTKQYFSKNKSSSPFSVKNLIVPSSICSLPYLITYYYAIRRSRMGQLDFKPVREDAPFVSSPIIYQ